MIILLSNISRYSLERLKVSRFAKVHRPRSASLLIFSHRLSTFIYVYMYIGLAERASSTILTRCQQGRRGPMLQTGDVNNVSAQARLFLPRRRFSQHSSRYILLSPGFSLSLFLLSLARVVVGRFSCSWASSNHRLAAFSAALTFIKSNTQWPTARFSVENFCLASGNVAEIVWRLLEKIMQLEVKCFLAKILWIRAWYGDQALWLRRSNNVGIHLSSRCLQHHGGYVAARAERPTGCHCTLEKEKNKEATRTGGM